MSRHGGFGQGVLLTLGLAVALAALGVVLVPVQGPGVDAPTLTGYAALAVAVGLVARVAWVADRRAER